MKSFNRLFAVVLVALALLIAGANLLMLHTDEGTEGRPYRVEISRLAAQIEEKGIAGIDLTGMEYVTAVISQEDDPEGLYAGESDCLIREIEGKLYRFDYEAAGASQKSDLLTVNLILGIMSLLVVGVLLYVRQKILSPFEKLTNVPYELSKGNLTVPIRENKSRFFGRFVWGVDLLRDNMEQQKQRELALQKDKKTLLLSLSHDIKTPLSAIKLYAKALSRGLYPDAEKQTEIAESINTKADEIERYVSQIVRASNEDFLSLNVTMGEFYLSELVEKIRGYYTDKLEMVKTDFYVSPYGNCLLKGDLERSIEVLQNVMENAIKYGDGASIGLGFSEEDGCVLVCVRNSGCTLPDTELPHIFDSFWRGSNADNRSGSGLGLYICRQLMHKMNGEIFAQMKDGSMLVTAVFSKV